MGWTSYHVDLPINRKHECDVIYTGSNEKYIWEVLKSTMVGSTYYAAVKQTEKETGESCVFAGVCLTAVDNSEYCNFYYKDMTERVGPYERKCPNSILKLLTETDSDWAKEWRAGCVAYNKRPNLGRLPIGTVIEFEIGGKTIQAVKHKAAYQFKTPFWMIDGEYIKKKNIPANFRVV